MRALPILLVSALVAGCGAERIPPPSTPAPGLASPAQAIPGDLDVALRLDLHRMRDALGPAAVAALERRAPGRAGAEAGNARLIAQAFKHADTVWIALRPEARAELMDNVIVLEGSFAGLDPQSFPTRPRWGPPVDLGADWRLYSRARPPNRAAPARIYVHSDSLLVFVSTAEIDSAKRAIEQHAGDEHMEPEAKGAMSIAARLPPLAGLIASRSPAAARLLGRGTKLSADADLGARGLDAELDVDFDSADHARSAADAAGLLAKGVAGEGGATAAVARALHIESVGKSLVVQVKLTREQLARLTACASSQEQCGAAGAGEAH
jgi:hypothetical protein